MGVQACTSDIPEVKSSVSEVQNGAEDIAQWLRVLALTGDLRLIPSTHMVASTPLDSGNVTHACSVLTCIRVKCS